MSTDERNKYFQELSRNLRHEGLIVKPETEEGLLPVELDGQRLCLVLDTGAVRYPKVLKEHSNDLLIEAAGRPGLVGRQMTTQLLTDVKRFSESAYRAACQRAIDINDPEKVFFLLEQTESHVPEPSPSFHGEMASYAYLDHRFIAREIIKRCSEEQIAAAPPRLLEQFAADKDFRTLSTLVEKGISGGPSAWRTLHKTAFFLYPNLEYACASGMSFLALDTKGGSRPELRHHRHKILRLPLDCRGRHQQML